MQTNLWRLKSGLLYAGLVGLRCVLVERNSALVFDERDNQQIKLHFWQTVTGFVFEVESDAITL